jgi:hypothetical protein
MNIAAPGAAMFAAALQAETAIARPSNAVKRRLDARSR